MVFGDKNSDMFYDDKKWFLMTEKLDLFFICFKIMKKKRGFFKKRVSLII